MNNFSHTNLQELCRACLRTLQIAEESANITDGDCDEACNPNSLLLPNLSKLFMLLTTYDINKELDDFPKRLCERCYSRLLDYDEFHQLVIRSTEMLYEKLDANEEELEIEKNMETEQSMELLDIKQENNVEENYDDKLLLPELANIPLYIKPESVCKEVDTQFTLPSNSNEVEVKSQEQLYESYDTEENVENNDLLLLNGSGNNNGNNTSIHSLNGNEILSKKNRVRKSLHCNACNKQFYKQIYLDAHMRGTHFGQEKPFQCSNCTKAFKRYSQLVLHNKSKHKDMLFRCDYENCDATYEVAKKLKMHRQVAHSLRKRITPNGQGKEKLEYMKLETDHICYLCNRKYSSKRALKEHIKRHKKIKEHVCPECGVAKVTRTELSTHMRTHTPNVEKFSCPQCPQVFNHKNAISRHVKVIHEGLRRFKCTYCPRRFGTRNSQVCHERLHTGERPFTCEICKRGFVQVEGLRSHMKNHDKNLRKHVCKYCSQRFITLKNLTDHERRHLGDKPNICNICNKGFHIYEDLKNHRRIHLKHATGQDK